MTVVVGARHNGKVYIGSDSLSSDSNDLSRRVSGVPKVYIKDNQYIIGGAGSWRAIQVIRHAEFPKLPRGAENFDVLEKFMVTTFIDKFEEAFAAHGVKRDKEEEGFSFLVGAKGYLFTLEEDHQMNYHIDFPYDVIGAGYPFALGAMNALWEIDIPVEEKIVKAIQTAERFSTATGGPINILSL